MAAGTTPVSALSIDRRAQLLAVEDPGFAHHHGMDFTTPGQGMTTITQALVKIFYFDKFSPGFAKIEQSLIARFVLDPAASKEEQLRAFINYAYFGTRGGRRVVGFEAAAKTYHHCSLNQLSNDQFLGLVAMLMAPDALDPIANRLANSERVRRIKLLFTGQCRPTGFRDVTYSACSIA